MGGGKGPADELKTMVGLVGKKGGELTRREGREIRLDYGGGKRSSS